MAWLTLLLLFLFDVPLAAGSTFISPTYQGTTDTGRFSESSVWELGSSQLVAFQTDFDAYWIELWQQNLVQAKATLASTRIYTQETGQDLAQSFYWTVQTYDINLSVSPVFYLWLRDANSSAQQSSAFFNITTSESSSSSSTTSTTSSSTTSSTSTTESSSTSTTLSTSSTTNPTTAVAGTVTSGADSGASDTANKETNEPSSSLSTGATVGIAVGASVVGLAGLVWAGIFCWTRRRKRDEGISRSEQTASWAQYVDNKPQYPPSYYQQPPPRPPGPGPDHGTPSYRTVPPPVEMGLAQHGEAVEIGDSYR